jgi:hypothetical protein
MKNRVIHKILKFMTNNIKLTKEIILYKFKIIQRNQELQNRLEDLRLNNNPIILINLKQQ